MDDRSGDQRTIDDAIAVAHRVVWAVATTVDAAGRPRNRVVHPVWTAVGPHVEGWVSTRRSPVKVRHLAANPHLSCAYLGPDHDVAYFDCTAGWVDRPADRRRAWAVFAALPPPVGFDPASIFPDGPDSPGFAVIRLRPYRIQVGLGPELARGERPRLWRGEPAGTHVAAAAPR